MAKKSRRRVSRFDKNESGCMWGLIRMLHFRHVHSGQRFLSDWKRGSKRVVGALSKPDTLEDSSEICEDSKCGMDSEVAKGQAARMSVKELMKEEMIGEKNQKKHASDANDEPIQSESTNGVYSKKIHRRMKKKSFDLMDADESVPKRVVNQKHKPSRSLDLSLMMEELFSQIPLKHVNHSEPDLDSGVALQPRQDSSVIEQQLGEATKVFIRHFFNEKNLIEDRKIQTSKELLDALHVLNSNKEIFLKLLQDPDSQLLLNLRKLQDFHLMRDENSQQSLEQVVDKGKQNSFFRKKFKSLERSLSNRNNSSEDLSRIVLLKPGPASSYNSGTPSTSDNGQLPRCSSNFSFTDLRRKLKLAVRKELQDCRVVDKATGGENGRIPSPRSPRKDHFFIEKVPKPVSSLKKRDNMGKSTESGQRVELGTSYTAEQRVSNIYIEAKKHIAEVVGNSDVDLDFLSRQVPKSLGKILSLPYFTSPVCSPRLDGDRGLAAMQRKLSSYRENKISKENACHQTQEITVDLQGSLIQPTEGQDSVNRGTEGESRISEDKVEDEAHGPDQVLLSKGEGSEVVGEVLRSNDTEVKQSSNQLDFSSPECGSIRSRDAELVDSLHSYDEKGQCTSLELDALEASSSSGSQSGTSPTKEVKDLEGTADRVQHVSPVSVLDLSYTEDDVSSPCSKSIPVLAIDPIQPRQIQFEEQMLPLPDRFAYINACGEDKKTMFEFIKAAVEKSGLTWDELHRRYHLSDNILDPLLLDELEYLQDRLCDDPKLIFDLIEESLAEACLHHLGPTLSFKTLSSLPELKGKDLLAEVWEGVDWHFQLERLSRTLQQILSLDYLKDWHWVDLRPDTETIGFEIEATIFEELMEDTILDYIISCKKHECLLISLEPSGSE